MKFYATTNYNLAITIANGLNNKPLCLKIAEEISELPKYDFYYDKDNDCLRKETMATNDPTFVFLFDINNNFNGVYIRCKNTVIWTKMLTLSQLLTCQQ